MDVVTGNATAANIKGMSPSTKYRVVVYGVDGIGQPYRSLERVFTTKKGITQLSSLWYLQCLADIK